MCFVLSVSLLHRRGSGGGLTYFVVLTLINCPKVTAFISQQTFQTLSTSDYVLSTAEEVTMKLCL